MLRTKYGYAKTEVDLAVGSEEDKCCDVYMGTLFPCTAVTLQILLLREIKKREEKFSKLLLGPRLAIRKGIDVRRRKQPVVAVSEMER